MAERIKAGFYPSAYGGEKGIGVTVLNDLSGSDLTEDALDEIIRTANAQQQLCSSHGTCPAGCQVAELRAAAEKLRSKV